MSKFYNHNTISDKVSTENSWRVRDTPGRDKWPISRWFQKYHLSYKTEQLLSRESRKLREKDSASGNEKSPNTNEAWKLIKKETNLANPINTPPKQSNNNRADMYRIATTCDVVHRIQELKKPQSNFEIFGFDGRCCRGYDVNGRT